MVDILFQVNIKWTITNSYRLIHITQFKTDIDQLLPTFTAKNDKKVYKYKLFIVSNYIFNIDFIDPR